jgi:hypothetical protein
MSTFTYELGYALGVFVREFWSTLQMHHCSSSQEPDDEKWPLVPTQQELDTVPAIVRKGVDLKQWYDLNVREAKTKRSRKTARPSKQ